MTTTTTNNMIATHAKDKYLIVLPTFGAPFIHSIYRDDDEEDYKKVKDAVMGFFEPYDRKGFTIHPMFSRTDTRWDLARQFLNSRYTRVYVNEDGIRKCGVNMATVITNPAARVGGCPHLMGEIALGVSKRVFEVICGDPRKLTLHKNPLTSSGNGSGCWEVDDEEEREKIVKEFEEKGYDFIESTGMCYLTKA